MCKNNFTNENEFDFKFDFSGVMPESGSMDIPVFGRIRPFFPW